MKRTRGNRHHAAGRTTVTTVIGMVVGIGVGLAVGALWGPRATKTRPDTVTTQTNGESQALSEGTKAILRTLHGPVELRLYSTLDPANTPDELKAFSHRLDQLLSAYQEDSGGQIKVTRLTSLSYTNASAAVANGIKASTLNNGNECLLGLVVVYKGHKEVIPQLLPEWEAAMEIDITRAIQNAVNSVPATSGTPIVAGVSRVATEDVKHLIPNLENVSLADGTKILRDAALKEFEQSAKESQAQLKEAQQRLVQAQNGGSEADQQEAVKHLQEVQAAQSEKLKEIAAKSRAQIDALRALKGQGR